MSTIDTPVRKSLDDIVATFDRNSEALAEAKIRLLHSRWRQYIATGSLGDIHVDIANFTLPDG